MGEQLFAYTQRKRQRSRWIDVEGLKAELDFAADSSMGGKKSCGEMGTEVTKGRDSSKSGDLFVGEQNKNEPRGLNWRQGSPALHVNEDRVAKESNCLPTRAAGEIAVFFFRRWEILTNSAPAAINASDTCVCSRRHLQSPGQEPSSH